MTARELREHCRALDIEWPATLAELEQARRMQAQAWHPDRHRGNRKLEQVATQKLQRVNDAFDKLRAYLKAGGQLHTCTACHAIDDLTQGLCAACHRKRELERREETARQREAQQRRREAELSAREEALRRACQLRREPVVTPRAEPTPPYSPRPDVIVVPQSRPVPRGAPRWVAGCLMLMPAVAVGSIVIALFLLIVLGPVIPIALFGAVLYFILQGLSP